MPSYDVHQHLWPEPLVEALRARREAPRLDGDVLELAEGRFPVDLRAHDPEERLRLLDRDRIDVAVLSLPPTLEWEAHPELADAYHAGARELVAAAGGRFLAFACGASLPGFAGACVSAQAVVGGLDELPAELARASGVLFVHPGPPAAPRAGAPPWWGALVDYTAQMQAAYFAWLVSGAAGFGDLDVVFAILGGGAPFQLERLRSRGTGEPSELEAHVLFDTASYGRHALGLCLECLGAERLVYGSDVPVVDSRPTLAALAGLGEDVLETARSVNPTRLFG